MSNYDDYYLLKEGDYLDLSDEEEDHLLNLKVKRLLSLFTNEYSTDDIDFIKSLKYPKEVEYELKDFKQKVMVDDFEGLSELVKSLPLEDRVVIRIQDVGGIMSLVSKVDE